MELFLESITQPFMLRALLAGLLIGPLLGVFGIIVSMRRMAFFGEGIAHASLAGIAIGLLINIAPLPIAIIWGAIVGGVIYIIEQKSSISTDAAIGILFTTSMAFGIIMISLMPGYQPELMTYLFGNILAVRQVDIITLLVLVPMLYIWFIKSFKNLTITSINKELAHVRNINTELLTFAFYILLAVALVLSTKIMGIILISALLITPAATAKTVARSYKGFIAYTTIASVLMISIGLIASYLINTPSGPMVVITGSLLFLTAQIAGKIK